MLRNSLPTHRGRTSARHRGLAAIALLVAFAAACGSRKREDMEAERNDSANPAKVSVSLPNGSQDAEAAQDPCQLVLKQEAKIVGNGIEAEFTGQTDRAACESGDKKPILYLRTSDAQFSLPVELDCQPKPRGSWNLRCANAAQLVDGKNQVRVRIKADGNYRSSQTGMMLTYEKP